MENIDKNKLNRKIGYLNHALTKLETRMINEQAERLDIKNKLLHLQKLQ